MTDPLEKMAEDEIMASAERYFLGDEEMRNNPRLVIRKWMCKVQDEAWNAAIEACADVGEAKFMVNRDTFMPLKREINSTSEP